jgi:hypothetical protein
MIGIVAWLIATSRYAMADHGVRQENPSIGAMLAGFLVTK